MLRWSSRLKVAGPARLASSGRAPAGIALPDLNFISRIFELISLYVTAVILSCNLGCQDFKLRFFRISIFVYFHL